MFAAILAFAVGLPVGLQVAMTTCTNPKLQLAQELECRVVKPSCARQRETRGVELTRASTEELNSGTTVVAQLWRTDRSGVSITTLRALVGGRVVFNTCAYFVSFAILGLGLLCACSFRKGQ